MYKNLTARYGKIPSIYSFHFIVVMKTIFLLTVVFLQLSMAGHSQSVTLRVSNTSATQVLYQLSRQSGYDFI